MEAGAVLLPEAFGGWSPEAPTRLLASAPVPNLPNFPELCLFLQDCEPYRTPSAKVLVTGAHSLVSGYTLAGL